MARYEGKARGEVPVPPSLAALWASSVAASVRGPTRCSAHSPRGSSPRSPANRVCDVGGGTAVTDLEPSPGPSVLLPLPMVTRGGLCDPGPHGGASLVASDTAVTVAIDDTLFHRRGPQVHAASWFHDGSAQGAKKVGYGNNWVIAAIVVHLAFLDRPIALPVGFALVVKNSDDSSRLALARRLVEALVAALPTRRIEVVADSAYAGRVLRGLPGWLTWTTRLRSNASLYELAPPRTGKRGRPRLKGTKLPALAKLATSTQFTSVAVTRYGTTTTVSIAVIPCLWYGVFGPQAVQVVFVRDKSTTGYAVALVTTDLAASAAQVIERYASRWSIEVAIEDAKQTGGVGQARNRVRLAVERTVPFALIVNTLVIVWYATVGYHPDDVEERRELAPWYRDKAQPSVLDMFTKLRRVIVASYLRTVDPQPPTSQEITILRLAWEDIAA